MAIYGYDKNTDYKKLMDEAVKAGDYARAAIYEQQRNEKIAGEGLTQYGATNQYSAFLPGSQRFENPYKADLDAALGRLQDKSAYEKAYLREADRTMEDTLAQYGTMTGGLPSTQAVAAASQAADYYKSQLPEKLADLDRQNASLLLSAGSQAQSEYQAMISQALARWSQLGYADDHVAQILGVNPGTPTSDQSYINWQKGQQDKSDAYTMAMTMLQAGQMPNADTLAAAGITAQDAQSLLGAYTTPTYTGGGGSGYDGKKTEKETTGKQLSESIWNKLKDLYALGSKTGNLDEFVTQRSMYEAMGYDLSAFDTWAEQMYGGYRADNGQAPLPPTEQDILALGFGPISLQKLDELIRTGVVEEYEKNGKTYLRRTGKPAGSGTSGPAGPFIPYT